MGRKLIKKHLRDKEASLKYRENKIKELQALLNDKNKEIKELQKTVNSKAVGLERKTADEVNWEEKIQIKEEIVDLCKCIFLHQPGFYAIHAVDA